MSPYHPKSPESFWLRRLLTNPMFPGMVIFLVLVSFGACQWAKL